MHPLSKYQMNNGILTKILWIRDEAALHANGVNRVLPILQNGGNLKMLKKERIFFSYKQNLK